MICRYRHTSDGLVYTVCSFLEEKQKAFEVTVLSVSPQFQLLNHSTDFYKTRYEHLAVIGNPNANLYIILLFTVTMKILKILRLNRY